MCVVQTHHRLMGCLLEHLDRDIIELLRDDAEQRLPVGVEEEWMAQGEEILTSLELPMAEHVKVLGHGNSCIVLQGMFNQEEVVSEPLSFNEHLRQ